jgi:hypothetical protein
VLLTVLWIVHGFTVAVRLTLHQVLAGLILFTLTTWLVLHRRLGKDFVCRVFGSAGWAVAVIASGAFVSAAAFSTLGSAIQCIATQRIPESGAHRAIDALAERLGPDVKVPPVITVDDLTATGRLPGYAKVWLRGARIEVRDEPDSRQVIVILPNGKTIPMQSWSWVGGKAPVPRSTGQPVPLQPELRGSP